MSTKCPIYFTAFRCSEKVLRSNKNKDLKYYEYSGSVLLFDTQIFQDPVIGFG
ncbi:hypothetical protein C2G38_2153430 [Gigaspora rosea]|uniref:Uncharacterized protein n=1 Tax=Gigaspora rosea TaxID=44941 RepID=A0A397WD00_9GLOM|nr:hypothetical protein C2G38_2153430 [Gigaspora rosea]